MPNDRKKSNGKTSFTLNAAEKSALDAVLISLQERYPGKTPQELLGGGILPHFLGAAPLGTQGYKVAAGAIFHAGIFCVLWGKDPDTGHVVTVLHQRADRNHPRRTYLGAPGGFIEEGENLNQGLLREVQEELCDDRGNPVIPIDENKLVQLHHFADPDRSIQSSAYAYELNAENIRALKLHEERFKDKEYKQAVYRASGGETRGIRVVPLMDIGQKIRLEQFAKPAQFFGYCDALRRILQHRYGGEEWGKPSSAMGHTMRDIRTTGNFRERLLAAVAASNDGKARK